jgi:hypothetical protein
MSLTFNTEENDANLLLMDFMDTLKAWGLDCNGDEQVRAIHTLQMYVFQHALQRTGGVCGEWYSTLPRKR